MSAKNANTGDLRAYTWACIVYPESAPADWREQLEELKMQALISPLHDKDKNPQDEDKKPHWHVMLIYSSKKSEEQAKLDFAKIGGVGCERVSDKRSYARYLCHLDNPSKAQYATKDVQALGGIDYLTLIDNGSMRYQVVGEMIDFIEQQGITCFSQLMRYARREREDWFHALTDSCAYVIDKYIKSSAYELQQQEELDRVQKHGRA